MMRPFAKQSSLRRPVMNQRQFCSVVIATRERLEDDHATSRRRESLTPFVSLR
jgi:hypothetical protein